MNMLKIIFNLFGLLIFCNMTFCQFHDNVQSNLSADETLISQKKKLNFFIVSKRHKGKLDLASRFNVLRTKLKSLFRRKKFVSIVAGSAQQASSKMQYRLKKYNARIGTLWFDSHGMYKKGYSLFFIGHDEYSYKSLKDSCMIQPMKELSLFSDRDTKVIIGSCYGGATYERASIDYKDTTRMNGDSLMIALGKIFNQSSIYGCESWVMSKPGLFLKRAAVAGCPGRKLFRDVCYQPAWENMGKWNEYNAATNNFSPVNPITMDMYGNMIVRTIPYTQLKEVTGRINYTLNKLRPGMYK
ncbi:MAG: hypothetical protein ABUT20_03925 [Bacteroidota bacterium]